MKKSFTSRLKSDFTYYIIINKHEPSTVLDKWFRPQFYRKFIKVKIYFILIKIPTTYVYWINTFLAIIFL